MEEASRRVVEDAARVILPPSELQVESGQVRVGVYEKDAAFFARAQGYGLTLQQGSSAVQVLH